MVSIRQKVAQILYETPQSDVEKAIQMASKNIVNSGEEQAIIEYRLEKGRDPYDGQPDDPTDFEEWLHDWMEQRVDEALFNIETRMKDGVITLYRVITASENWTPQDRHPGLYWSWDEHAADAHWGSYDQGQIEWLMVGQATSDMIDWPTTLAANACPSLGEDEKEVRLLPNAPIKVLKTVRR